MTTAPVTQATLQQTAQNTQKGADAVAKDYMSFLNLLTTQLKNQDPMNPMDSAQFTSQLVQFNQVEQAINTNTKLDSLLNMQMSSGPGMALGYVGLNISYASSEMNFDGGTPITISYNLPQQAATSKINVIDSAGRLVYSGNVPPTAGTNQVIWNGQDMSGNTVAPGTYSVQLSALDGDQKAIAASTTVTGYVRGVESQNGAINLLVGDRAVPLTNVINAILPLQTAQTPQG